MLVHTIVQCLLDAISCLRSFDRHCARQEAGSDLKLQNVVVVVSNASDMDLIHFFLVLWSKERIVIKAAFAVVCIPMFRVGGMVVNHFRLL